MTSPRTTTPRRWLSDAGTRYATARESLRERAAPYLGVDPRALGAFRIALALVVLADLLVYRLPAVETFYTDDGVLPRSTLGEAFPLLETVSIHAVSGSARVQTGLIAVAACAAVCLLVGYRPRASTGLSAVLLASLYARNPYVLNGGNTILVAFLGLSLFVPLDARWSIGETSRSDAGDREDDRTDSDDRVGTDCEGDVERVCSLGTAVALLTLASIYAANAVSKYRSDAWLSGVAVPRILQLKGFTVGLGPLVSDHAAVLAAVNWLWIALLSVSVLLVAATGRVRAGVALAFVSAHLGMAATLRLGVFPFVMTSVLLLCLPAGVWDRVEAVAPGRHGPTRLTGRGHGPDDGRASEATPPVPSRARRGVRAASSLLLVGLFLALVWWQAAGVGLVDLPASESDGGLSEVSWSFFAPNPPDASNWYVVRGTLASGEAVDLRDGGALTHDRPPDAAETSPTTLWYQFGFRLQGADESRYRPVAAYACERSDRDVTSVTVTRVEQPVGPTGPVGQPEEREQVRVAC